MKNTAVLVSGGVDSSVALKLAHEQGAAPTAFYLKIWLEDELAYLGNCPWQEDLSYVEAVCSQLKVPLEVISLQKEYWERVVSYTISEIKVGRTPNPDIMCNQQVKFGAFFEKIDNSFDTIATGHYARTEQHAEGFTLLKMAPDSIKDQTYFLARLSQEQIARAWFPIGGYVKDEVRQLATRYNLPTKDRKDSQGICFLGKLKFTDFIKHHVGEKSGRLVEYETGSILGSHKGFWFHTIGQRQGLGLSGGPWYVIAKNIHENVVYVSRHYYEADKKRDQFIVQDCNWITQAPSADATILVKMRHGPVRYTCRLQALDNESFRVVLQGDDQGIAPGQFAVFYEGDVCLGSGVMVLDDQLIKV